MVKVRNKKNGHLAPLTEHWFEWNTNQTDVGSNPTVRLLLFEIGGDSHYHWNKEKENKKNEKIEKEKGD